MPAAAARQRDREDAAPAAVDGKPPVLPEDTDCSGPHRIRQSHFGTASVNFLSPYGNPPCPSTPRCMRASNPCCSRTASSCS
jgi:hypothetical protein